MVVLVPETSGFCPGVKRAEEGVFKLKSKSSHVNLHGALIHNQNYSEMLQEHKISSVDINTLKNGETLVIRTHGISRHQEQELAQKYILQDLTCPIVKHVQKHVEKASLEGAFVIISGKADHAEVQGLVSYADFFHVIENQDQLDDFLSRYQDLIPSTATYIYILSQTTHTRTFFEHLCTTLKKSVTHLPIEIKDTICPVTEKKEEESLCLQKEVDFTVVIGDPLSSNSKKLYILLKNASPQTIFAQNLSHLKEIKKDWHGIYKVLVVSSTSTPIFIEQEIVSYLEKNCPKKFEEVL